MSRISLPHCQYGVWAANESQVSDCGKPAVARWVWPDNDLYVCEEHDIQVEENQMEDEDTSQPELF